MASAVKVALIAMSKFHYIDCSMASKRRSQNLTRSRRGNRADRTPPLSSTTATPTVTIAGAQASVSFSGLAPGSVGKYQGWSDAEHGYYRGTVTGSRLPCRRPFELHHSILPQTLAGPCPARLLAAVSGHPKLPQMSWTPPGLRRRRRRSSKNAPTNGGGPEGTPAWKATLRCCNEVPREETNG